MTAPVSPEQIEALFTRSDGSFVCARWGRPVVPIVFGVEDRTLMTLKGAIEAVVVLADHKMAETDPELGANLMMFFCRDWEELLGVPDLDRLIDGLAPLVQKLSESGANQYRVFRFDQAGAIRACFVFLRMDAELSQLPAATLALGQAAQSILLWSDRAFTESSPLGLLDGQAVLKPEIAAVIRAAYDPVLPAVAHDPSHALRIYARMQAQ
ncbi:hypothetical protein [Histidinibacterium aquaticum]|uniref:Uncharacterized protein n=1 Tax=Histidinibacterium aquaticum TaxID=2613962 RepID=A0A5J5GQ32_9RHOB|nr:hypothetical protein [Histidinibacterium aquaticum]KAA9010290.1 hypothetical protein F3S47_03315 [Histidinibacterium aquaticum]